MTPTTQTDSTHAAIRERHMQARRERLQAMMELVAKNPTRTSEPSDERSKNPTTERCEPMALQI
jgi:hypothetical protein